MKAYFFFFAFFVFLTGAVCERTGVSVREFLGLAAISASKDALEVCVAQLVEIFLLHLSKGFHREF